MNSPTQEARALFLALQELRFRGAERHGYPLPWPKAVAREAEHAKMVADTQAELTGRELQLREYECLVALHHARQIAR